MPGVSKLLTRAVRRVHGRYAQYLNARRLRSGHLWQNRFYSCALDDRHVWTALRYVEMNPVRARIVPRAVEYPWSSAAAHVSGLDSAGVLDLIFWRESGGVER